MVNLIRGVRGNTLRLKVERGDHVVPNIQVIIKNTTILGLIIRSRPRNKQVEILGNSLEHKYVVPNIQVIT